MLQIEKMQKSVVETEYILSGDFAGEELLVLTNQMIAERFDRSTKQAQLVSDENLTETEKECLKHFIKTSLNLRQRLIILLSTCQTFQERIMIWNNRFGESKRVIVASVEEKIGMSTYSDTVKVYHISTISSKTGLIKIVFKDVFVELIAKIGMIHENFIEVFEMTD